METIAQAKSGPFNLQVMIPVPLKRALKGIAGDLGVYQRDIVTEALEHFLPLKRKEVNKLLQAENTKATAKRRKGLSG